MCGIAGFLNFNTLPVSESLLKRMTDVIAHRGPDDDGQVIIGPCALGNRRLAVIDLSPKGHMPMWDESKRYCITFNGEIYNFKELRTELENKGHHFASQSDTEVVLHLYKELGPESVTKLRGMFAYAIWDTVEKSLFLARDHFGIKPLHYFSNPQVFVFGSEIKSILLHPDVKKKINLPALSQYFSVGFGAIPSPNTIFEGIHKLPPASYMIVKDSKITIKKYWSITNTSQSSIELPDAIMNMRKLIEKSVQDQLVSDVPLGTFLSGGLDSSLISAFAQRVSSKSINTFSIGFEDKHFDESKFSLEVANYLKTNHHHHQFSTKEMLDCLADVVEKLDEPLADASIFPTYLLSKFTRAEVTVALSGDGGDELFAGYPTYLAHYFAQPFRYLSSKNKERLLTLAKKSDVLLKRLPLLKHSPNISSAYKFNRFFNGVNKSFSTQYLNFMGPMFVEDKDKLLQSNLEIQTEAIDSLLENIRDWDRQKRLQALDLTYYLSEDCLVKTDRASSFNSLEVRVPFLTPEIAESAFSLPSSYHLHNLTLKHLLKLVASPYLPQDIINRPKKGFGIPTHQWLKTDLNYQLHTILQKSRLVKQGFFNADYVDQLIKEHETGVSDHRMVLWNLFIFELWYERWFK